MRLKYLTESAYDQLYSGVKKNNELYEKQDPILPLIFPYSNYAKDSSIVINDINLQQETFNIEDDIVNVKIIFSAMKKLTPEQASNVYLWTWLSHEVFFDYIQKRWKPSTEGSIKDRFFCDTYKGSRTGLFRNGISRLWWYGYVTYIEGASNPFALTEILLSNSDLCLSLVERKFSMNRNIMIGILQAIKEINEDNSLNNVSMDEWRDLSKYLNRYGAVTMLDFLTPEEVKAVSIEYILKHRG